MKKKWLLGDQQGWVCAEVSVRGHPKVWLWVTVPPTPRGGPQRPKATFPCHSCWRPARFSRSLSRPCQPHA